MVTYRPEIRERALWMLAEASPDQATEWAAIRHVAQLLGMRPKRLRLWRRRAEVDSGAKPGVTSEAAEEIKRRKREIAELKRANEILKSAPVFFAEQLGRPATR